MRAALREDVKLSDLAKLATADPAFALKVLATVNSPIFGPARKVSDLNQAAMLLGIRGMRNLALGMVVADMAPDRDGAQVLLANSLRRALAARSVARLAKLDQADDCFMAGLLLEAGMLAGARQLFEPHVQVARAPAAHRVVRERALGLRPHPGVGAELAQSLGLPASLVDAIALHHDTTIPRTPIAAACWVAERVAAVFESGDVGQLHAEAERAAQQLNVGPQELKGLLAELPEQVRDLGQAMGTDVGATETMESLRERAHERLCDLNQQYGEVIETLSRMIEAKEKLEKELTEANVSLRELTRQDPLTGLANRRFLDETLARDLARAARSASPLSVAMVDIDHFKRINDGHGHQVGDLVIRRVGDILKRSIRTADFVARYGGEEFVLVLAETDAPGALVVAERVRLAIEAAVVEHAGATVRVTASIGVATFRGANGPDATTVLIERADAALYAAKNAGRNRACSAPPK